MAVEREHVVARERLHERVGRAAEREARRVVAAAELADAGEPGERAGGRRRGEGDLDRANARCLQRLDVLDELDPAVAQRAPTRSARCCTSDRTCEERNTVRRAGGLAHELVEGLLDERIEAGRRLVEDQQLRAGA